MNESFGELSRPMRNRGVEIYFNELDPQEDIEDIQIILKTLFPFDDSSQLEFQQLLNQVLTNKTHFADILKLFKITYDYWLISKQQQKPLSIQQCFELCLQETKFKLEQNQIKPRIQNTQQFNSDVFLMKEFQIYRFLFNFPIYSLFIQNLQTFFESFKIQNSNNLNNYSNCFLNAIKSTNFVNILLKSLPCGHSSLIFKYLKSNFLKLNSTFGFKQQVELLFAYFEPKNRYFEEFVFKIGKNLELDLSEENIDLKSNQFLLKKIQNKQDLEKVLKISNLLDLILKLNSSKFRLDSVYQIQNDSFISSIQETNKQFKFMNLIKQFYELFFRDIQSYLLDNVEMSQVELDETILMATLLLLEKFYLISTCSFDSILTLAYLKYFWNFIFSNIQKINTILNK